MWRALAFVALLAVAAYGAVWLADRPGVVTVTWGGYELATSLAAALVGVMVLAVVLGFIWAFARGILNLPERLTLSSRRRRQARGYNALSRGMVAVGSGDPVAARRHAGEAERLLGNEPLALLLTAQAAQISGDRAGAERAFQRMVDDPETRVLGLRGLFVEARRQDDEATARAYAIEASRLAPSVTWANEAVMESQCADRDWSGALDTVSRRAALGLSDKAAMRRQRAVLLTASALDLEAGDPERALAQAREAVKLAPDLVPAAALAGRLFARRGDLKRGARVVEAAWRAARTRTSPGSISTCAPVIRAATASPAPRRWPGSRPGIRNRASPSPARRSTPANSPGPATCSARCSPTSRPRAPTRRWPRSRRPSTARPPARPASGRPARSVPRAIRPGAPTAWSPTAGPRSPR